MPNLSVTVITKNESANLKAALESVAWADEIVLVDAESSDDTVEIARRFTDRVFVRPWPGFATQKNHAASLSTHHWILSLDADERVPPELGAEIRQVLAAEPSARGFRIPRVAFHLGRWLRSTDWYPDHQLRLYDRRVGQWENRAVHESVRVSGPVATLGHELQHYPYRDIAHHLQTIDRYTTLAAGELAARGEGARLWQIAVHPPLAFLRNYILRGGIRDGAPGFIVSVMNAYYVFLKYAKLWETRQRE